MNRIATTLACLIATLPLVAGAADPDPKLEAVRAKVAGMFDSIEPEHVNPSPVPGWYLVQKGSIVAYISDDGRSM
jgi:hypothetical protein